MSAEAAHQRKRVIVEGRVQGVGFRFFVRETALRFGLTGIVRNLPDGQRVEVHLQGAASDVAGCIAAIRRGPPSSLVTSLRVDDEPLVGHDVGFEVTR